jgi:hypothetical protein
VGPVLLSLRKYHNLKTDRIAFSPIGVIEYFAPISATILFMKRATITISDQLEPALEAYLKDQEVAPNLTRLLQTALGEFLAARGYGGSKTAPRAGGVPRTAARPASAPSPEPRPTPEQLTPQPSPQPPAAEVEGAWSEPPDEDETDTALL